MTHYRHFILPPALLAGAATAPTFAFNMAGRRWPARRIPQKPALASWEDEGGSVAAPVASAP